MNQKSKLSQLLPGEGAYVEKICLDGGIHRRLLDIGLIKNTRVECIGRSPCGDPAAYWIRGAVIAIRSEDSEHILLQS